LAAGVIELQSSERAAPALKLVAAICGRWLLVLERSAVVSYPLTAGVG
jgi:hypothetical protein